MCCAAQIPAPAHWSVWNCLMWCVCVLVWVNFQSCPFSWGPVAGVSLSRKIIPETTWVIVIWMSWRGSVVLVSTSVFSGKKWHQLEIFTKLVVLIYIYIYMGVLKCIVMHASKTLHIFNSWPSWLPWQELPRNSMVGASLKVGMSLTSTWFAKSCLEGESLDQNVIVFLWAWPNSLNCVDTHQLCSK